MIKGDSYDEKSKLPMIVRNFCQKLEVSNKLSKKVIVLSNVFSLKIFYKKLKVYMKFVWFWDLFIFSIFNVKLSLLALRTTQNSRSSILPINNSPHPFQVQIITIYIDPIFLHRVSRRVSINRFNLLQNTKMFITRLKK